MRVFLLPNYNPFGFCFEVLIALGELLAVFLLRCVGACLSAFRIATVALMLRIESVRNKIPAAIPALLLPHLHKFKILKKKEEV